MMAMTILRTAAARRAPAALLRPRRRGICAAASGSGGGGGSPLPEDTSKSGIPYVWRFRGHRDGSFEEVSGPVSTAPSLDPVIKRVTILGGVHGNEIVGVNLVKRLAAELQSGRWTLPGSDGRKSKLETEIVLGLGNPKAIELGTRGSTPEGDLNRSFTLDLIDAPEVEPEATFEAKRARELAPLLMQTDVLLDIHATNLPSEPFIRVAGKCTAEHISVASWFAKLPNQTNDRMKLLLDPFHMIGGKICTTDEFVNSFGGIGVCLETGLYNDLDMEDECYVRILEMLNYEMGLREASGQPPFDWPAPGSSQNFLLRPYGVTRWLINDSPEPEGDEASKSPKEADAKATQASAKDADGPTTPAADASGPYKAGFWFDQNTFEDVGPGRHPKATRGVPDETAGTSLRNEGNDDGNDDDVDDTDDYSSTRHSAKDSLKESSILVVTPPEESALREKFGDKVQCFWAQNVFPNLFEPFKVISAHRLTERGFAFENGFGERNWDYVRKGQPVGRFTDQSTGTEEPAQSYSNEELYVALAPSRVLFPKTGNLQRLHKPVFWLAAEIFLAKNASAALYLQRNKAGVLNRRQLMSYLDRVRAKNDKQFLQHMLLTPGLARKGTSQPWRLVSAEAAPHIQDNKGDLPNKLGMQTLGSPAGRISGVRFQALVSRFQALKGHEFVRGEMRDLLAYFPYGNGGYRRECLIVYPTPVRVTGEHFMQCGPPYSSPRLSMPFTIERFDKGSRQYLAIDPFDANSREEDLAAAASGSSEKDFKTRQNLERILAAARKRLPELKLEIHDRYILSELSIKGDAYLMCDATLSKVKADVLNTMSIRGAHFKAVGATYHGLWQIMYAFQICRIEAGASKYTPVTEFHPAYSDRGEKLDEFGWQRQLPEPVKPVFRDKPVEYRDRYQDN